MGIRDSAKRAIQEHIAVPDHIRACASACLYDLLHGPSFACVPKAGIEAFTVDHYATFQADLEDCEGEITETYSGPVGEALRAFIAELPSTLYLDDGGFISESEPQGEWLNEEGEPCESTEDDARWSEPEPYTVLSSKDLVAALFGDTMAREFN